MREPGNIVEAVLALEAWKHRGQQPAQPIPAQMQQAAQRAAEQTRAALQELIETSKKRGQT